MTTIPREKATTAEAVFSGQVGMLNERMSLCRIVSISQMQHFWSGLKAATRNCYPTSKTTCEVPDGFYIWDVKPLCRASPYVFLMDLSPAGNWSSRCKPIRGCVRNVVVLTMSVQGY